MKKFIVCALALAIAAPAMALIPNFQGFEDPNWAVDTTTNSAIRTTWNKGTRTVSGSDGLTSFNGGAHLRVPSGAGTSHGGYITDLMPDAGYIVEYAVYIDIANDFAPDAALKGFAVDTSTNRNNGYMQSNVAAVVNGDSTLGETWVRMFWDNQGWSASAMRYLARTRTDAWDIPSSGWYNLSVLFVKENMDADPAMECASYLRAYDAAGNLLYTSGRRGGWLDDPGMQTHRGLTVNALVGPASLAMDDVQTKWVPEPASLSLLALGALMMLRRRR